MGSGVSGEMKLLTTGLGLLRSAALLSNDTDFFNASKQVSRAVSNIAGVTGQVSTLLKSTAKTLSANGNTQWGEDLEQLGDLVGSANDVLDRIDQILGQLEKDGVPGVR